MRFLRYGYITGPLIGALWTFIITTTVAVAMSFVTGDAYLPSITQSVLFGVPLGLIALVLKDIRMVTAITVVAFAALLLLGRGPIVTGD